MQWNDHSKTVPKGAHAFLSPSGYHWLNYDPDKLESVFRKHKAVQDGVETHEFAAACIKRRQKLPKSKKTLNMYVNDAIGFNMQPEQILYFSENCFGTCDAISFRNMFLRIHDLKTGETKASMRQLEVYAALFCLEYDIKPGELSGCELRIYQNNDILIANPKADDILPTMSIIRSHDNLLMKLKGELYGNNQ